MTVNHLRVINTHQSVLANQIFTLTFRVLSLALREERGLHLQIVLKGQCLQGVIQRGGRREDDSIGNHVGVDDSRIEQIRSRWGLESFVDGHKVGVESVAAEHVALVRGHYDLAKLLDLVLAQVQALGVRDHLEGGEAVGVLQRAPRQNGERLKDLLNNMQVLFPSELVLHHQVGAAPQHLSIVNVNGVLAAFSLPGYVKRWVALQISGNLEFQIL